MPAPTERALSLLDKILKTDEPTNVDRGSVTITGEGPVWAIILVPHRDLGGFSLVLWFDDQRIHLVWASVFDLRYHDDIDLGKFVATIEGRDWADDPGVESAIRGELRRPIRVSVKRTHVLRRRSLRCGIDVAGRWIEVGVGPVAVDMPEMVTSLMGPVRPAVRRPVPLDRWRRSADPAWPREAGT